MLEIRFIWFDWFAIQKFKD